MSAESFVNKSLTIQNILHLTYWYYIYVLNFCVNWKVALN